MGDSAEVVTDFVGGKEKKEVVNHSEGTGSFRKNGKSNLHSRGVYFHKISIFATVPSSKLATNYSSTPSRSLRILFSLASKVAPPTCLQALARCLRCLADFTTSSWSKLSAKLSTVVLSSARVLGLLFLTSCIATVATPQNQ